MSTINPNNPNLDPNRREVRRGTQTGILSWIVIVAIIVVIIWFIVGTRGHRTMAGPSTNNRNAAQQQNGSNGPAITDVSQLTSSDPKQLVGKSVDLAGVTVSDAASSGALLIDANGKQVLVVNEPAANSAGANPNGAGEPKTETNGGAWHKDHPTTQEQVQGNGAGQLADRGKGNTEGGQNNAAPLAQEHTQAFKKGDTVTVQGTIEKMPSEHDAMTQFNLSTDEAVRAANAKVYIAASSIQPAAK